MSSHGVDIGMIQVPPQGQPIVLMADAQTTGGYPKIATVINADIGLMAQIRFGKTCQFVIIEVEQALREQQKRQYYIEQIKEYAHES
jgi:allophanate hydrolase subunit 2